jgi:pimeloyl-ACP methyl ester carboxylesterase
VSTPCDLAENDRRVRLPDGRHLGVASWGNPDGTPVFDLHGLPGSRLQGSFVHDAARDLGVRLLAVDRPGIGLSDRRPGHTVSDWPAQLAAVADALGIDRFGVLGWSGGGPYTVACAAMLGKRVTVAVDVAGMGPADTRERRKTLDKTDALLMMLSLRAPWLARTMLGFAKRQDPKRAIAVFRKELAPPDRASLDRIAAVYGDATMEFFRESQRNGAQGVVDDYRALAAPWRFRPEDVDVPFVLWHGAADISVPPRVSYELADRIPGAVLHEVPDEGHLVYVDRAREILATFV